MIQLMGNSPIAIIKGVEKTRAYSVNTEGQIHYHFFRWQLPIICLNFKIA